VLSSLKAKAYGGTFACVLTNAELDRLSSACTRSGLIVRRTSSASCQKNGVVLEWARVLGFPDYYGKNWDAFNECFREAAISPPSPTVLLVDDAFQLLRNESGPLTDILQAFALERSPQTRETLPPLWVALNYTHLAHVDSLVNKYPGILPIRPD
jgi:hypothetical protein